MGRALSLPAVPGKTPAGLGPSRTAWPIFGAGGRPMLRPSDLRRRGLALLGVVAAVSLLHNDRVLVFALYDYFGLPRVFGLLLPFTEAGFVFHAAFAIWFGLPGLAAIYAGTLLGAALAGTFEPLWLLWALRAPLAALPPMLASRLAGPDLALADVRSMVIFTLAAALGQLVVGIAWSALPGLTDEVVPQATWPGMLALIFVAAALGIPLMRVGTPGWRRLAAIG